MGKRSSLKLIVQSIEYIVSEDNSNLRRLCHRRRGALKLMFKIHFIRQVCATEPQTTHGGSVVIGVEIFHGI